MVAAAVQFEAKAFKGPYDREPVSKFYKVSRPGRALIVLATNRLNMHIFTVLTTTGVLQAQPGEQQDRPARGQDLREPGQALVSVGRGGGYEQHLRCG